MTDISNGVTGKKIIIGVSGGIAAYKVVQVARDLAELGADVHVAMTPAAQSFVGVQTFASLTGNPVLVDLFDGRGDVPHVELARGADLAIVAPATANVMAKMTHGIADDAVSATVLTLRCPVIVVPAMHTEMWEHPATQQNIATLRERGVEIAGPASGPLSSGDEGLGRMIESGEIVEAATRALSGIRDLEGRRVVVTAGGTREAVDPVRYIGNHSSGRMGYLIAEEAARRGAKVSLITAPSPHRPPSRVDVVRVTSADEMREAVLAVAGAADIIVKAAAVADFKLAAPAARKTKKTEGPPRIELVPTIDILAELGSSPDLRKPGGILVGFAAETEADPAELGRLAQGKLRSKGADLVVANQVGVGDSGFEAGTNRAVIASRDTVEQLGLIGKGELARILLDRAGQVLRRGENTA